MRRYYDAHLYFANWGTHPPVPAGLGSLTASQRALADFLRVDADLLDVAAKTSPPLPEAKQDPRGMAAHIASIPASEKDRPARCWRFATDQATRPPGRAGCRGFRDSAGRTSNAKLRALTRSTTARWPNSSTPRGSYRQQREQKVVAASASDDRELNMNERRERPRRRGRSMKIGAGCPRPRKPGCSTICSSPGRTCVNRPKPTPPGS